MTNMRVIEHRLLLNNTKNTGQQSTSWANTLIFRPSLITLFKAELAVQIYICQWCQPKYLKNRARYRKVKKAAISRAFPVQWPKSIFYCHYPCNYKTFSVEMQNIIQYIYSYIKNAKLKNKAYTVKSLFSNLAISKTVGCKLFFDHEAHCTKLYIVFWQFKNIDHRVKL